MGYNNNSGNTFGNQPCLKDLVLGQTKINDSIKPCALISNGRIQTTGRGQVDTGHVQCTPVMYVERLSKCMGSPDVATGLTPERPVPLDTLTIVGVSKRNH